MTEEKVNEINFATTFAYTMFYLEGQNELKDIMAFDPGADKQSDDSVTIRASYGPRLRYWVGPDDIVAAQKKNKGLEEIDGVTTMEEMAQFSKPNGTDQIGEAIKFLKKGRTATIQFYDPSVDTQMVKYFDPIKKVYKEKFSNSFPTLQSLWLISDGSSLSYVVNALHHIRESYDKEESVDYFFFYTLYALIASWLGLELSLPFDKYDLDESYWKFPDAKKSWFILKSVFDFKKHLINSTYRRYLDNPDISIEMLVDNCCRQFIDRVIDLKANDDAVGAMNKIGKSMRYIPCEFPKLFADGCRAMAIYRLMKLDPIQFSFPLVYSLFKDISSKGIARNLFRFYESELADAVKGRGALPEDTEVMDNFKEMGKEMGI